MFIYENHFSCWNIHIYLSSRALFLVWNEEREKKTEKEWVRFSVNSHASRNGRLELSCRDEHLHLRCFEPTQQVAPHSPFIKPFSFFLTTHCIFNGRGREMTTEGKNKKKTEAVLDKRAECETYIRVGNLIILWHEEKEQGIQTSWRVLLLKYE